MKSAARWPPARARCWSSMPPRAWKRNRPAHRRHRARQGRNRGRDRHRRLCRRAGQRQDRPERAGRAGSDRAPHPAAGAARHREAAGADHRLVVRQLPGRGLAGARDAGRDQAR
ncbi:hypothetical protein G6F32_014724 [Rhizopus arrhizus]|nr:hypothetical protein G6F32_014724 [Rhizopus arrhizus]